MEQRTRVLIISVIIICVIILSRLFYIQIVDSAYKSNARQNSLRYIEQIPLRGEIYDRNGEFLVQSRESYDLMCIPREMVDVDTLLLAQTIGMEIDDLRKEIAKARNYSVSAPSPLFKQLPKEVKYRLEEQPFNGIYTQYRTQRAYPRNVAGNLLGYISEVSEKDLKDSYYKVGDYIGSSGLERAFEKYLRGDKGVKIEMVDARGRPQGSYDEGRHDTLATPGKYIVSTIDAQLQEYAEWLLEGKVGSVVAIEPSTGEILLMVNSPTYDPNLMVGRDRQKNYASLVTDPKRPLFNRAVMAGRYPPGSTFKTVNGLIGMQLGIVKPTDTHECHGGYPIGGKPKCHSHSSPVNMIGATATSCNTYFSYVFRDVLDTNLPGDTLMFRGRYDRWREMLMSFGFGRSLETDFINESIGSVPQTDHYDKVYRRTWNSLTVISMAIGQGEMGATPLQMANLAAIIANRGYYYIPHVVRNIEGADSIDSRFLQRQYTAVESRHFEPIVEGMYQAVHGNGTAVYVALEGLDQCGKTGTSQNSQGADHSVFMSFAPRNNPKIAIYVFIEHGGFGASVAAPIASLITEKYLTDTITRPYMERAVRDRAVRYPMYEN